MFVRYAAAELDCSAAVARDPAYVKAFCRRAAARVALRNYEGACSDYSRVLEFEPGNKLARTELNAVDQVQHRYWHTLIEINHKQHVMFSEGRFMFCAAKKRHKCKHVI